MGTVTVARLSRLARPQAGAAHVFALVPPYDSLRPLSAVGDRDLPLGTVVAASGNSALAMLGALTLLERRWPWIVPALMPTPQETMLQDALGLVSELRYRVALLPASSAPLDPDGLVEAVRRRPFPPPGELAHFVAVRLGDPAAEGVFERQFAEALGAPLTSEGPSSATLSRFFSRHGDYTARDWRSLAMLMRELVARSGCDRSGGGYVSGRTVDDNARRFLGASAAQASRLLGWEWMLEQALRTGHCRMRQLVSF